MIGFWSKTACFSAAKSLSSAASFGQSFMFGGGPPVFFHISTCPASSLIIADSISFASFLLLGRHAFRDRPAPDLVPRGRLLGARAHRKRRHADLAGDFRALWVVELAEMRGIDEREGGVAGHEDRVRLVAAVGRHAGRADLVRVDRVPPVLDDLAMAGLGHRRLEARPP